MEPDEDYFNVCLRLWTKMLRTFIGWDEAQTKNWALHFKEDIANENSVFYLETPEWYVANTVFPCELHKSIERMKYEGVIREIEAICTRALTDATTIDEIDWRPAKEAINSLLSPFGYSLDDVAKETSSSYRD